MGETLTLAKVVEETELDDVSSEAIEHAKRSLRDFIGVALSYGASVTVKTRAGQEYHREIETAPGGPSNPISDERLKEKFVECVGTVLTREDTEDLWQVVGRIDSTGALKELKEPTATKV